MFTRSIKSHKQAAITLLELSIVIVIITALVVSFTIGEKLIENAKTQKIISELYSFRSNYYLFKNTYRERPGDLSNANNYWGQDCNGASSGSDTCSGNGDGDIESGNSQEAFRALFHIKKAGFIFDELASSFSGTMIPGVNIVSSSIGNQAGYSMWGVSSGNNRVLAAMWLGTTTTNSWNSTPVLTTRAALRIDGKIDDQKPASGKFLGYTTTLFSSYGFVDSSNCVSSGEYNLANEINVCGAMFIIEQN